MSDFPILLITGAAKGIGRVLTLSFKEKPYQLILLDKNKEGLETLHDALQKASSHYQENPPLLVHANLKKLELIDALGLEIFKKFGRLDAFLSCHGILEQLGPVAQFDRKIFDQIMLVNFVTNFRLIQSLDPLFQKASSPKLVFLTCEAAKNNKAFWGPYGASKAALEALVRSYREEQKKKSFTIELFDPGPVTTELRGRAFPGEKEGTHQLSDDKISELHCLLS